MHLLWSFSTLLSVASAFSILHQPQHVFSNPPEEEQYLRIPTVHESTIMARRILSLAAEGSLVTVFPEDSKASSTGDDEVDVMENRPQGMGGSPIGLMEYIADCEGTGNPTLLAIDIATPFRNYKAGSNISLSVRWWPDQSHIYSHSSLFSNSHAEEIPTPHTPAALPRFSLQGRLEPINLNDVHSATIPGCFLKKHPDSFLWQPGNDIHSSKYVRFVVEEVYWFGGFGDRARIGWLPIDEWRNVTSKEINAMRLPGEKSTQGWWRDWL